MYAKYYSNTSSYFHSSSLTKEDELQSITQVNELNDLDRQKSKIDVFKNLSLSFYNVRSDHSKPLTNRLQNKISQKMSINSISKTKTILGKIFNKKQETFFNDNRSNSYRNNSLSKHTKRDGSNTCKEFYLLGRFKAESQNNKDLFNSHNSVNNSYKLLTNKSLQNNIKILAKNKGVKDVKISLRSNGFEKMKTERDSSKNSIKDKEKENLVKNKTLKNLKSNKLYFNGGDKNYKEFEKKEKK